MTMLRLNAITFAVLGALTLTACGGGDTSLTSSAKSAPEHWLAPKPVATATTNAATTPPPPKPNSDSDKFTTFGQVSGWDAPTTSEELPKEYYTAKIRGGLPNSLHEDIEKAYGQRFETTFKYTTQIADGNSDVTGRVYRNSQAIPLDKLGNGHRVYTMNETAETHIDGVKYSGDRKSRIQLYQQPNSIVLGKQTLSGTVSDGTTPKALEETPLRIDHLRGKPFLKPSSADLQGASEEVKNAVAAVDAAKAAYDEAIKQNSGVGTTGTTGTLATSYNTPNATNPTAPATATPAIDTRPLKEALDKATADLGAAQAKFDKVFKQYGIFSEGLEFNYAGEAFNQNSTHTSKGKLEYAIDFNTLTGHGKITGLDTGTINLNNADMGAVTHTNPDEGISRGGEPVVTTSTMLGIQGVANFADGRKDGKYTLGIFGDYAEEVAGFVTEDNVNTVGFGGVKK